MNSRITRVFLIYLICVLFCGCDKRESNEIEDNEEIEINTIIEDVSSEEESTISYEVKTTTEEILDGYEIEIADIPDYNGEPYVEICNNHARFSSEELTLTDYEYYSELDGLGRCGVAMALVTPNTLPKESRGKIGSVKPSGWHTVKYNEVIEDNYLYNRCHLIAYELTGQNANEKNLITGTRYMNIVGMLPFENKVEEYVSETGKCVLYRTTPIFDGDNLVASGVTIEAKSVEDKGEGIDFYVYVYNVQPNILIDYSDGSSMVDPDYVGVTTEANADETVTEIESDAQEYVLNTNTKRFHYPYCSSVDQMKEKNRKYVNASREELLKQGYKSCGNCNP